MDKGEVTDVEVQNIIIKGKKYLIDSNNVVYSYAEDLSKEQPEEVGELVDGELQEYSYYAEIDEDRFEDKSQYYEISKLNLYLNFYKDQDDDIFEIAYYNKEENEYTTISGIQREGQIFGEDEKIEDIEEILFPLSYDIKHSSDVLPIEANFYIGYDGVENEGFLSYSVFWNGTINIGDNVEEVDTDLDLSVPVGNYLVKIDDDVDIDEFDFEERKNILIRSAMLSKNNEIKQYTIQYQEGKNVNRIIYDNFIVKQKKQIKNATVTIQTESYKRDLTKKFRKLIDEYSKIKTDADLEEFGRLLDNFNEEYNDDIKQLGENQEKYDILINRYKQSVYRSKKRKAEGKEKKPVGGQKKQKEPKPEDLFAKLSIEDKSTYSYNQDIVLDKINRLKEKIKKEKDKDILKKHRTLLDNLNIKLEKAKKLDKLEEKRIIKESESMATEDINVRPREDINVKPSLKTLYDSKIKEFKKKKEEYDSLRKQAEVNKELKKQALKIKE